MKSYAVDKIPPESYFTKTVYLDQHFVLTSPEMPFSEELAQCLADWKFLEVYSEGEPRGEYNHGGEQQSAATETLDHSTITDRDKIQEAERFYAALLHYTERLFVDFTNKERFDTNDLIGRIKNICDFVRENRHYLMRVQKKTEAATDENYLASHSVRSTIIAIIIGIYLKLPNHRLIELGGAALLHEVGMLQLPQQVYLSRHPLNPQERKLMLTHPVLGYNILKASGFPLVMSIAALEHHERENGSGYPRGLDSSKISLYSKIIAVACSYEALSARRPHKEAKDGYTGMLELLKNEDKQYDNTVVRALVYSLSIYPIGLYVLLSSGKKGQVVDVNPETPRYPVVQIFGEISPDGKNKTVKTSPDGLAIVRPLTREEIGF